MADTNDQQPTIPNRPVESFLSPHPLPLWPVWVAPTDGAPSRLVYVPHDKIQMLVSNIGRDMQPLDGVPARLVFNDTKGTFLDLAQDVSMTEVFSRVLDMSRMLAANEKATHDRYLLHVLQQAQEAGQTAEQVVGEDNNAAALLPTAKPQAQPLAVEEAWDGDEPDDENAQPLENSAQQLIDDVGPENPRTAAADGVFPKAAAVRKRNRRR